MKTLIWLTMSENIAAVVLCAASSFPMDLFGQDYWTSQEFLQKVFREAEGEPTLCVASVAVENATVKGDAYFSQMYRLKVEIKRRGTPINTEMWSLIMKTLPIEETVREVCTNSSAFPNEVRMYKETLSKMDSLIDRHAPGRFPKFGPKCYYLIEEVPYLLILEDLTFQGFKLRDRRKGLDLEHCLLVIRTLARFHASSIALHEEEPTSLSEYPENPFFEESAKDFWKKFIKSTLDPLADMVLNWPDFGEKYANKIRLRSVTLWDDLRCLMTSTCGPLRVLAHGDLWVNNILFRYRDDTDKPTNLRFIDFQYSCHTSPGVDLQFFLNTSPDYHVRQGSITELLGEYHKELCKTLKLLGQCHHDISFQEIVDEYDRMGLWGVFTTLVCLSVTLCNSDDACDFKLIAKNEEDFNKIWRRLQNEAYTSILKQLLPVFDSKGLL